MLCVCGSVLVGGLHVVLLLGQVLTSLAAVLLLCGLLRAFLVGPYYKKLHAESKGSKEILVLGTTAFIFVMLTVMPAPLHQMGLSALGSPSLSLGCSSPSCSDLVGF